MSWLLSLLLLLANLKCLPSIKDNRWCPPPNFRNEREKRINSTRVSLITDIHGLQINGKNWGTLPNGNKMARFIYHYIGSLGFDMAYVNVMSNVSAISPPSVQDIFPATQSCVTEWARLGVIDWFTYPYAGTNSSEWEIDPHTKERSLKKDLYKVKRGLVPRFNAIQSKRESDWLLVLDVDEMLVPIHFQPQNDRWCHHSQPSLINQGLQQMLKVASSYTLPNNVHLTKLSNANTFPCPIGSSLHQETNKCKPVAAITFPVYLWSSADMHRRTDTMPDLRTRVSMAYEPQIKPLFNTSDEAPTRCKEWKSMHNMAVASPMQNISSGLLLHFGINSFNARAPNKTHGVLSFELAHFRSLSDPNLLQYLSNDSSLHDLTHSYSTCMALLVV